MRISDWSSDVCSSDLRPRVRPGSSHSAPRPSAGWPTPFRLESVATPPVENQELKSPRLQGDARLCGGLPAGRSEEHTSELQSLMRISYAVFCLTNKNNQHHTTTLYINISPSIAQSSR